MARAYYKSDMTCKYHDATAVGEVEPGELVGMDQDRVLRAQVDGALFLPAGGGRRRQEADRKDREKPSPERVVRAPAVPLATPSEHRVAGEEFPMEMHLVHQGPGGSLLVVGIFLREGHRHGELEKVFADLPDEGETTSVAGFKLSRLLPGDRRSLRYRGSLTTPPFTEGVSCVVLADPLEVPGELIDAFQAIFPDGNSREPQPLNGRTPRTDAKWKSVGKAAALEVRPGARLKTSRGSDCRETGILADSIGAPSSP